MLCSIENHLKHMHVTMEYQKMKTKAKGEYRRASMPENDLYMQ